MKLIVVLLSALLLNGCFLFMHKCDSLTGWCTSSNSTSLQEYDSWRTKKELKNLQDNFTLTLGIKEREEEDNKKKSILLKCKIDPYTGELQDNISKSDAYTCAYQKGICIGGKDKGMGIYTCSIAR